MNETRTLLGRDDPPPFIVTNPGAGAPFVLVSDHGGRAIPARLNGLGVGEVDMERHIAWDLGIEAMGDRLAALTGACLIRQTYSRLVIDCNRDPAREDAMPKVSDGSPIPGNAALTDTDRTAREQEIFKPYHGRIAAELEARKGQPTLLVAIHSFTPVMKGFERPWRFGVLHLGQSDASDRLLQRLRDEFGETDIGDNEPYAMDKTDYTIPHHAIAKGLDYIEIETRQDLLADEAGQQAVAEMLARMLEELTIQSP